MGKTTRFDSNDYIYNPDSKKGVYIIHGYSSSTYEVKDLAKFLGDNGFLAVAKNLPGHGTTVEDCNRAKYTDWIEFVEQDIAKLASKCDEINLIGSNLIGFKVVTDIGIKVGALKDIMWLPANDVYVVFNGSKELLIPIVPEIVLSLDYENKEII